MTTSWVHRLFVTEGSLYTTHSLLGTFANSFTCVLEALRKTVNSLSWNLPQHFADFAQRLASAAVTPPAGEAVFRRGGGAARVNEPQEKTEQERLTSSGLTEFLGNHENVPEVEGSKLSPGI